jgi:TonB-dependent starch-binding outer membrane protein SusC
MYLTALFKPDFLICGFITKTIRIMKLATIFIIAACLQVSAKGYPQKVTLKENDISLQKLFEEIRKQTGYHFFYADEVLVTSKKVSLNFKKASIGEVLDFSFKNQHLTYTISDNTIIVKRRIVDPEDNAPPPQTAIEIKGKVTNDKDQPIAGASIILKGTGEGTATDENGNFTLLVPDKGGVLVISYVGFETTEVPVSTSGNINVKLKQKESTVDEVVVVGYGTQRKSDITGSVASVKTKDIAQNPLNRVDQALQGRVPGLLVQNNNGAPSPSVSIRIRGVSSVNGGNNPLVVIDGLQLGSLGTLDPNDVESIEVLKDASATSIYGARGSNGVILVTTKKGKKGIPAVAYNGYFGFDQIHKKIDLLNAEQYALTVNARRADVGLADIFSASDIAGFKTKSTDWQDAIFRQAFSQNHQLSLSGANDNTSYYISGNLNKTEGIIKGSSLDNYSLRSNVKTQVNRKISLGLNLFLNHRRNHPTSGNDAVTAALQFAPVKPIYNPDGTYSKPGGGYGPSTTNNPLALAVEPIIDNLGNATNVATELEYKISRDFKLSIQGAYQGSTTESSSYVNSKATGNAGTESATIGNTNFLMLQNTNMLTYEKRFQKHSLNVTGVVEQQYIKSNESTAGSKNFLTDAVTYNNLSLGANPQIPSSNAFTTRLLSYMGRINYAYDNRYSLTLTGRYDGSSVFGDENKWGFFPSAGLAWNMTNENFLQGLKKTVSSLKLRASYGVVGNQAIGPYRSLASLNNNLAYVIDGTAISVGVGLGRLANPDLKWEKTAQLNIGLDAEFLKGRINFVADYYNKKTTDLLFSVSLPQIGGGSLFALRNVGAMENKGVEFYLGGKPVVKGVTWETGFTLSINRNKVTELYRGLTKLNINTFILPGFGNPLWLEVGQPVGLLKGYIFDGVWKTSEAAKAAVYGALPGYPKFVDQNKDNTINSDDITNLGSSQPKFIFGWNNTVSYQNFDMNIFVQGVQGNKLFNVSRVRSERSTADADATSIRILNRWTPTNENTDVPSFGGKVYDKDQSSRWLEDGSYIRLQIVSIGYTLPASLLKMAHISSIRIYASGTNLFTQTKYSGYEPESNSFGLDTEGGIDLATYPSKKSFIIGLNVKF